MFDLLQGLMGPSNENSALEGKQAAPSSRGMSDADRKKLGQQMLMQSLMKAGQTPALQSTGYVPMNNSQFAAGGQMIGGGR